MYPHPDYNSPEYWDLMSDRSGRLVSDINAIMAASKEKELQRQAEDAALEERTAQLVSGIREIMEAAKEKERTRATSATPISPEEFTDFVDNMTDATEEAVAEAEDNPDFAERLLGKQKIQQMRRDWNTLKKAGRVLKNIEGKIGPPLRRASVAVGKQALRDAIHNPNLRGKIARKAFSSIGRAAFDAAAVPVAMAVGGIPLAAGVAGAKALYNYGPDLWKYGLTGTLKRAGMKKLLTAPLPYIGEKLGGTPGRIAGVVAKKALGGKMPRTPAQQRAMKARMAYVRSFRKH